MEMRFVIHLRIGVIHIGIRSVDGRTARVSVRMLHIAADQP
jgi:hypothetical protein